MKIIIDAMGGDNAPMSNVLGGLLAVEAYTDIEIIFVGLEEMIREHLPTEYSERISIINAREIIATEDEPVRAVRSKKNSSMVVAANLIKEEKAEALISAGNTGALMAAGLLITGRIKGIERPALATVLPTVVGDGMLLLDSGANMDPSPEQLIQYALMGDVYSREVLGVANPRIGLLNVGTEETKGNELMRSTYTLLKKQDINFVGNIEARDVPAGVCDVLIADGFSGNVVLKLTEGVAGSLLELIKEELLSTTRSKMGALLLKPALKNLKKRTDYSEVGGAPLLGLNGAFIKAHGSSNEIAIMNAVRQARLFINGEVKNKIMNGLK